MAKNGGVKKQEHGVVAVEFAIVLFWLVLLVMGAIDFGYFLYAKEVVTNAAREGARAGSVIDPSDAPSARQAARDATNTYLQYGGLNSSVATSTATDTSVGGTPAIQVGVQYPVGSLTGFLKPWLENKSANATAVMRWQ